MLLPAIQYGDWPTVKRRMSKIVTQLKRGTRLIELMTEDGMLDVAEHPGVLVMHGIKPGSEPSFHCFAPWRLAADPLFDQRTEPSVPTPIEDAIFAASLTASWAVLGLLSPDSLAWWHPKARHEQLLHAALDAWNELDAVGPRYCWAGSGERLWSHTTGLKYVLARMGVPTAVLRAPLPPGGPRELLQYARPAAQA